MGFEKADLKQPQEVIAKIVKTVATLMLLLLVLPLNLALTAIALLRSAVYQPPRTIAPDPKTILISGGKMTKALQLARSFDRAGHRVILVESHKYWLTGHRFSWAVDRFYTVPKPQAKDYIDALLEIVKQEGVDVYIPVCSPVASYYDAEAKQVLSKYCKVRLKIIASGKDAIFDWADPLPFLMVHHAQIPWLLLENLRQLKGWMRIDFNIGKLVEPAGD